MRAGDGGRGWRGWNRREGSPKNVKLFLILKPVSARSRSRPFSLQSRRIATDGEKCKSHIAWFTLFFGVPTDPAAENPKYRRHNPMGPPEKKIAVTL